MANDRKVDPVELAIFKSLYSSVADEMGVVLRRSAFSVNIKERRDYSCAVFDRHGVLIAQGDHMPVHLGSMPMSVRAALEATPIVPGDVVVLNDPYAGGTHLPDATMVSGVFESESNRRTGEPENRRKSTRKRTPVRRFIHSPVPMFYVANRAHHSDIGGAHAGSMGASTEIYQEGLRIPPIRLMRAGEIDRDVLRLIVQNVRSPTEREGDLTAQLGAMRVGERRLREIVARYGFARADFYARALVEYAAETMRRTLDKIPDGVYTAEDFLDDDGESDKPVRIAVRIKIRGSRARIDFTGSSPQVRGAVNAVEAITVSAVYYVFRCLVADEVPASAGILQPLEINAPQGTIVNATPPAPVAGGNVETSQRIVDVLLAALQRAAPDLIPAASQGTMNNLSFGGIDPGTGENFAYYETIAGGMGARPQAAGLSGIHTHMTNSLNTPTEALEFSFPVRIRRYSLRSGSGGKGRFAGGEGIVREIEFLTDARVSMLSDRRRFAPYGLRGGRPGRPGRTQLISGGTARSLPGKFSIWLKAGDRIRVESPGGGGYGFPTGRLYDRG